MLHYAEQITIQHHRKKIILSARFSAMHFYKKSGYQCISSMYISKAIPHILMEKKI
ncbi:MAG: hypothetical protein ACRCR9_00825 [Chitinophagaceae bacterium]